MPEIDPFNPIHWEILGEPMRTPQRTAPKKGRHFGRAHLFLRGPVSWPWLLRAMKLPGKSLAVGLMLWLQRGFTGKPQIHFCISPPYKTGSLRACARSREKPLLSGRILTSRTGSERTARRAIGHLEDEGLIKVTRLPGRGLDITIIDVSTCKEKIGSEI